MSESSKAAPFDVPPGPADGSAASGESPAPSPFADDSGLSRALRACDRALGLAEQAALVGLLLFIVCVATATVAIHLTWADEAIRYGVFAMAMLGGAYATHHQRLLSMDVLSRVLSPRGKALLRVALSLFTLAMTAVLLQGGLQILSLQQQAPQTGTISTVVPAMCIPIGMALIAVHLTLQALIELDYLRRGRTAPEPQLGAA